MRFNPIKLFLLSGCLVVASSVFATTSNQSTNANAPLPDNPSLGRVILYKTGKTLQRAGDATQRTADKASNKIHEEWQNTKDFSANQAQTAEQKTNQVEENTKQKWQQTKEVVTGRRSDTAPAVPIEQKSLSQPSNN